MAAKFLYTMLYGLLFLLALLLVIRFIRSKEGFANPPTGETYDLNLFFKKYPLERICQIYEAGFPKIVDIFTLDESGKKIPESVANIAATDYLTKAIITGQIECPITFPSSKSLKDVSDWVSKLDDNLLARAMNTLIFFVANTQVTATNSKKAKKQMEGFLTQCSEDELKFQEFVPLQCVPPDKMKATEQQTIDAVDSFDMSQRVSQKAQIAKKLATLVKNLKDFQKNFRQVNKTLTEDNVARVNKAQSNYDVWSNPSDLVKSANSEEDIMKKKQEWQATLDKSKNDLELSSYYFQFSGFSMENLIKKYDQLQNEINGIKDSVNSGQVGIPKS